MSFLTVLVGCLKMLGRLFLQFLGIWGGEDKEGNFHSFSLSFRKLICEAEGFCKIGSDWLLEVIFDGLFGTRVDKSFWYRMEESDERAVDAEVGEKFEWGKSCVLWSRLVLKMELLNDNDGLRDDTKLASRGDVCEVGSPKALLGRPVEGDGSR